MQLTQQIKIKPTKEQEEVLRLLSEKCRLIYNFALTERKEAFELKGEFVGYKKQQNDLPKIKKKYPEYNWVYSKVYQMALKILDADYKSFFQLRKNGDKEAQPPRWKGKKHFTTMVFNQSGFFTENNKITFSHEHPSRIELEFDVPKKFFFSRRKTKHTTKKGKVKESYICYYQSFPIDQISIYEKERDFFVSITYDKPDVPYKDNGEYQAYDLGVIKQTAVNSKGKFVEHINPRIDKYWNKKIDKMNSKRDSYECEPKKKTKFKHRTRKWKFYDKLVKRMSRRKSNQEKDYIHKLSRKMLDNTKANTLIVGDFSVKEICNVKKSKARRLKKIAEGKQVLSKKAEKGLHRSQHNTGIKSRLVSFLTYKAKLIGKRIIEDDETDTSKTCSLCGNKKKEMSLNERTYICDAEDCSNGLDRDENSSINQMCLFLSQNALWIRYGENSLEKFLHNLRIRGIVVKKPMVSTSKEALFVR